MYESTIMFASGILWDHSPVYSFLFVGNYVGFFSWYAMNILKQQEHIKFWDMLSTLLKTCQNMIFAICHLLMRLFKPRSHISGNDMLCCDYIMFSFVHVMFCLVRGTNRSLFQPLFKKSAHVSLWLSTTELVCIGDWTMHVLSCLFRCHLVSPCFILSWLTLCIQPYFLSFGHYHNHNLAFDPVLFVHSSSKKYYVALH
jgi:hypothetical protein